MNDIKTYLTSNVNYNTSKVFSFQDFKTFFQKEWITSQELIVMKFSKKTYIIKIPTISQAQIVINHKDQELKEIEQYFLEKLSENIYDIKKHEKKFISFLWWEIKDRYIFWWIILTLSLLLPIFITGWLLEYSKSMINLVFPLIGVYFVLMVIFLSSTTLNFNQKKFLDWKVNEYFSNDTNMAYLSISTMLYILLLHTIISLLWTNWYYIIYHNILIERYLLSLSIGIMIYLIFINFFNLVEYYMKTQQNFVLWKMKDDFFNSIK